MHSGQDEPCWEQLVPQTSYFLLRARKISAYAALVRKNENSVDGKLPTEE